MKKRVSLIAILLAVWIPLSALAGTPVVSSKNPMVFSTTTLDHQPISSELFRQYDLIMVNYWAETCGNCVGELPELQKIHRKYKNVLVLGAYVGDNPEKALAAAEKAGVSYPLFAVPYSFYQYITIRPDGTFSIPQACFFDRDGYQINGSYFTARTCDVWARTLEELLAFTASRKTEQQEEDPPTAEAKKPEIQTQPKTATVKAGKKVKFTVVAAGEGLKYQWYCRTSSQAKWKKVSGGTGASLSFTARAKMNGSQYRCRVRNDAGEVYSKTVRVKIRKK